MTNLPGHPHRAQLFAGFDTYHEVDPAQAVEFYRAGWRFCGRYLDRHVTTRPTDSGLLSPDEARGLLAAGLAIVPIQLGYGRLIPTAQRGQDTGAAAATNAEALGIPREVTLWCDLEWHEDVHPDRQGTIDYANSWHKAVTDKGYGAGLYVGTNVPLDGRQLMDDLLFNSYWKSASWVPWVEKRGFQMIQGTRMRLHEIRIDPDLVVLDARGDTFNWLAPLKPAEGS